MAKYVSNLRGRVLEYTLEESLKGIKLEKYFEAEKAMIKIINDNKAWSTELKPNAMEISDQYESHIKTMYEMQWEIASKAAKNQWNRNDLVMFLEKVSKDLAYYFMEEQMYYKGFIKPYVLWLCGEIETSVMAVDQVEIHWGMIQSKMMPSSVVNTSIIAAGKHFKAKLADKEDVDFVLFLLSHNEMSNAFCGLSYYAYKDGIAKAMFDKARKEYNMESDELKGMCKKYVSKYPELKDQLTKYFDSRINAVNEL